mgnify:FL=1
MVGPAHLATTAAVDVSTASAGITDAAAETIAGRALGDAGAVGADIRGAALTGAGTGAADRFTIDWDGYAGASLAHLIRGAARDRGAATAQASGVPSAGTERVGVCARLIRSGAGGGALVA